MNKLILVLLLFPLAGNAQFNKGDLFFGGSMIAYTQHYAGDDNGTPKETFNSFSLGPKFGYFVNEKWVMGGTLGYSYFGSTTDVVQPSYLSHTDSHSYGMSAGVFARRYFRISDQFFLALEGSLGITRSNFRDTDVVTNLPAGPGSTSTFDFTAPSYVIGANVQPYLIYFPTPRWGFEVALGSLSYSHEHNLSNSTSTNFSNLSVTSSVSLGFNYYFRKK